MTGLHCGNYPAQLHEIDSTVFPVFMTGLHCGELCLCACEHFSGVFPVFMTAPLRRGEPCFMRHSFGAVFPVFMTGLHCGAVKAYEVNDRGRRVFPVFMTGLHCGAASALNRPPNAPTSSRFS